MFFKKAKEYKLSSKIIKTGQKVCQKIISNYKTDNVSDLLGKQIDGLKVAVLKGEESQKYFDFFLRNSLSPFYPEQRSVDTLKQTLYDYFKVYLKLDYEQNLQKIIEILLSSSNESHFKAVIELAKVAYQSAVGGRNKEIDYDTNWQIPSELIYNSYYNLIKVKKSIMNPFYTKDLYKTESAFIKYLDNQKNVKWWFKNGDRDSTYFAIPYTEKGDIKPFYIDFIVCFQNNKIGLYDTKSGLQKTLQVQKVTGYKITLKSIRYMLVEL